MFEGTVFEAQPRPDPTVARIATSTQQMNLEFRQLAEQVAAVHRNQELLEARLTRLEGHLAAMQRSGEEVGALRQELQRVRAEREGLRKEITDDLAGRIETIASRQQAEIRAARAAAERAAPSAPASSARSGSGYEHKVERGQTLSQIARGYGKSMESIMKANKITNPSSIRVGQVLFIPD
jgi:LysM repeat protein